MERLGLEGSKNRVLPSMLLQRQIRLQLARRHISARDANMMTWFAAVQQPVWKRIALTACMGLCATSGWAQQYPKFPPALPPGASPLAPSSFAPRTGSKASPPVNNSEVRPAGLPQGNPSLQQPVYVAERSEPTKVNLSGSLPEPQDLPSMASEYEEAPIGLFDEQRALQSKPTQTGELFEAARVIAVVGDERVLIGDLIDPKRVTPEMAASREFEMALRKRVVTSIETKCLARHFLHLQSAGKSKKEREEIRSKVSAKTAEVFKTKVLPQQMLRAKCESELEFLELLEKSGTSLPAMLRNFSEEMWADQALREGVKDKPTVELFEMQDWYDSHSDDWNKPARVRFQIMSANFKKYPSREAAYEAIAEMGNQVFLGGATFDAVAKDKSSGFNSSEGGVFDWTQRGSLKSKVIEEAAFTIELQALSTILEDEDGFHIIKVLEREPDYRMSFQQAQTEIRKAIVKSKKASQQREYIQKVRDMTPVWSKWPEDIPGSRDLSEIE